MLHPAFIIVLAFLNGAEYFIRFSKTKNYIQFGKGLARFLLMGIYIWVWVYAPGEFEKSIFVRWAVAMLLAVDVFYIGQIHIMNRLGRYG